MWSGLQGLLETTWKYAARADCAFGIFLVGIISFGAILALLNHPIFYDHIIIWTVGVLFVYFVAIIPPVKRMADRRDELLLYVAIWGIISLTAFIIAFYVVFFVATGASSATETSWDRVLNFPPVIAAVVGAGLGWYVHQQLSAKFHRTGNSFALVIQMRTSSEFISHTKKLAAVYSIFDPFPSTDCEYALRNNKRVELDQLRRTISAHPEKHDATAKLKCLNELAKIEAIEGLKYLLNFYEFMAFAIQAADLDETLLYETISPHVVGWYNQTKVLREALSERPGDKLAFQHLERLVKGYKETAARKVIDFDGWEKRLAHEAANT